MQISQKLTGLSSQSDHPVPVSEAVSDRPLSLAWMTDELIDETRRVWSRAYGRVLSAEDAVEILANVKRFAEVLLSVQREGTRNERRDLGSRLVA